MPFKSEAQRRKFLALVDEGKMSQETYDKWARETREKVVRKLPDRIRPKKIKVKEI